MLWCMYALCNEQIRVAGTSNIYHFFMVKHSKILFYFEMYDRLLLTTISLLCSTLVLIPLICHSPISLQPHPPVSGNHHSTLYFYEINFFLRLHIRVRTCGICISKAAWVHLTQQVYLCCCKWQGFVLFYGGIVVQAQQSSLFTQSSESISH
jgi:hypothetical protein